MFKLLLKKRTAFILKKPFADAELVASYIRSIIFHNARDKRGGRRLWHQFYSDLVKIDQNNKEHIKFAADRLNDFHSGVLTSGKAPKISEFGEAEFHKNQVKPHYVQFISNEYPALPLGLTNCPLLLFQREQFRFGCTNSPPFQSLFSWHYLSRFLENCMSTPCAKTQ